MLDQCKAGAKDNKIAVTSVKLHEKYADHDPFFDVAIVRLAEKVTNIPVCLPTSKSIARREYFHRFERNYLFQIHFPDGVSYQDLVLLSSIMP